MIDFSTLSASDIDATATGIANRLVANVSATVTLSQAYDTLMSNARRVALNAADWRVRSETITRGYYRAQSARNARAQYVGTDADGVALYRNFAL